MRHTSRAAKEGPRLQKGMGAAPLIPANQGGQIHARGVADRARLSLMLGHHTCRTQAREAAAWAVAWDDARASGGWPAACLKAAGRRAGEGAGGHMG